MEDEKVCEKKELKDAELDGVAGGKDVGIKKPAMSISKEDITKGGKISYVPEGPIKATEK